MDIKTWQRPGFISLLDEIERRGREKHGDAYPEPPTEADIRRVAADEWEQARRNYKPEGMPALGGSEWSAAPDQSDDAVMARTVDEYIGPPRDQSSDLIAWVGRMTPIQMANGARIKRDLEREYSERRDACRELIVHQLRSELYGGTIKAVVQMDLIDSPISPMWWRLPEAAAAFETGQKDGLPIFLKVHQSTAKPAKNDVIVRCQTWLENLRRQHSNGPVRNKAQYFEEAEENFKGLTEGGFGKAWKAAAKAVPAPGWGIAGRKPSQPPKT